MDEDQSKPLLALALSTYGVPRWLSGKESVCLGKRLGFDLWVEKIPWRREWQLSPVILAWEIPWTEEPGGLWGHKGSQELDTAE